jgi:hypothetical protein
VTHFRKTNSSNQANITRSDDSNFDVFTHSDEKLVLGVEDIRYWLHCSAGQAMHVF